MAPGVGPAARVLAAGWEGRRGPGGEREALPAAVTVPYAHLAAAGLRVPLRRGRGAGAGQPGPARRPAGLPQAGGQQRAAAGARRLPDQRWQLLEIRQGPGALPGAGTAGTGGGSASVGSDGAHAVGKRGLHGSAGRGPCFGGEHREEKEGAH